MGLDETPRPDGTKLDPESLVLRARPRPVLRLRKGLTVGLAGTVSALLVALAWMSLKAPALHVAVGEDRGLSPAEESPQALAGVPSNYGDVPRLGPPVPGDLGQPILERRREAEAMGGSKLEGGAGEGAAIEEGARGASEKRAALLSGVLVQSETPASPGLAPVALPSGGSGSATAAPAGEAQAAKRTLSAGSVIPASLLTGVNSDIPGIVVAQVTEPVRDSATGGTVLIPQGARLVGSFDNKVAFGQQRALLVWHRILFPDGSSLDVGNLPASDAAGYSGLADKVDFHEFRLLKGIALATLLGVGAEAGGAGGDSDLARALRESAQDNGARAGDQIVARNLDIRPTLTIRPGWPVRAILDRDLELAPWVQR